MMNYYSCEVKKIFHSTARGTMAVDQYQRNQSVDSSHSSGISIQLDSTESNQILPHHVIDSFQTDGFVVFPDALSVSDVNNLNEQLDEVLRGHYDREQAPDKLPKIPDSTENILKKQSGKVLQVINVHKSNQLFRRLACHQALGHIVAQLAGWKHGTRLAQDQVWAKPPGAKPLAFHRDSPYFMFNPNDVVTVWVALDDMTEDVGPLEYVRGSHLWETGQHVGSARQFFQSNGGMKLLHSAAVQAGVLSEGSREEECAGKLEFVSMRGLRAGGISIHDGRTWHGSGKNQSTVRPRRGLGLHFVPAEVQFTAEAAKSSLWRQYVSENDNPEEVLLPPEDFPLTWQSQSVSKT